MSINQPSKLHCIECGCCPHEHEHQDHKPRWHKSQGVNVSGYRPIADYRAWLAGRRQERERALEAERAMYECGDWATPCAVCGVTRDDHQSSEYHHYNHVWTPATIEHLAITGEVGASEPATDAYDNSPWPAPDDYTPVGKS